LDPLQLTVNVRTLTSHKTHNAKISSRREINSKHIWSSPMYELIGKELVAPEIWKIKVRAPHIAKAYKPVVISRCWEVVIGQP